MAVSVDKVLADEAKRLRQQAAEERHRRLRANRRKARENDSFLVFLARMFAAWTLFFATISLPVLYVALYRAVGW